MKNLKFLFTAILTICLTTIFCGCKESDEQGLKHFYPELILFDEPDGKYELTIEYNGDVQTYNYDIEDTFIDVIMKEYDHYKEVLTEEEYDPNYTYLRVGAFYLETRKNVELKIEYIQEINEIKTKYTSTIIIPYVENGGYYYSGREDISFVGDNGKIINGYLLYDMMRTTL